MFKILLYLYSFVGNPQVLTLIINSQIGIATTFWAVDDPGNPNNYASCLHKTLDDNELVIAHPTLPCKSSVLLYNLRTGHLVKAIVGDRGPRHALVDLSLGTAKSLHANGFEEIVLIPLK